jgi:hypothetical protein
VRLPRNSSFTGPIPIRLTLRRRSCSLFSKDGFATLKVYNILGQRVATLFEVQANVGMLYEKGFNACGMSSGFYFARLESAGKVQVQKLVLTK